MFIIIGVICLIVGVVAGKFIFAVNTKKQLEEAESQSRKIISDAQTASENLKKEKLLEAKERFVQLKSEHDKEVLDKNKKINDAETRIRQKEQALNQKLENIDKQVKENDVIKENLNRQIEVVGQKRTELEKHQEEHIRRLEKISALTAEEAKAQLLETLKQEAQTRALGIQQEIIEDAKLRAIRKPVNWLSKVSSVPQPSKPLKIRLPYLTLKAMKLKARSLAVKDEISGPLKPQQEWTSLWMIPRKPLCFLLSIP